MSDQNTVPIFYGVIAAGPDGPRINLDDREGFSQLLRALTGREIEIRLQKRRRQRSLGQNSYFHGVVLPMIAAACGYDRSELQEVKDGLKLKFLRMSRSGVGIDAYRGMADTLARTTMLALNGETSTETALQVVMQELINMKEEDDRGKLQLVRSTADLDTAEFTTFIEDCRRWAAETLHIDIPDPYDDAGGHPPVRSRPRGPQLVDRTPQIEGKT